MAALVSTVKGHVNAFDIRFNNITIMSRLIVKNLPNDITTDKLRTIFGEKGEVTDVQLKYTKAGKFRKFGFIGYRTDEQSDEARQFFNGTCIQTSKISVEKCVSLGNVEKPKAWSKYSADSSAFKKLHNTKESEPAKETDKKTSRDDKRKGKIEKRSSKIREILEKHKDDPLFAEFMEVHASKIDKALWSNDSILASKSDKTQKNILQEKNSSSDELGENNQDLTTKSDALETSVKSTKHDKEKIANEAISDLEYMKLLMKKNDDAVDISEDNAKPNEKTKKTKEPRNRLLFFVKIQGLTFSTKKKDVKDLFRPLVPFTIRIPKSYKKLTRGFCYVGFRSEEERRKALFKNKSFLDGHRILVNKYENQNKNSNESCEAEEDYKKKSQEESLKNEESIAESGKIYVRNLPYITTEDEVQKLFEKYGPVSEANLPIDKITHKSKGFAHVTFMLPEHAVKAYTELDGSIFSGRMLHLLPGKQKSETDIDDGNLTYKQKKDKLQKAQANSSHNWNTLFLGANAVANVVADAYNTTKEKLLEGNSKSSGAVRLALGETQLVVDTKKFLEENGVSLDAFNQPPNKRSKTIILIKNMPADTTAKELQNLFEPFGLIARLILPPHGITALIEFVEPSEARQAFKKLAYTKFKHLPLYLEWAPDNVFVKPHNKIESQNNVSPNDIKNNQIDNDVIKSENKTDPIEDEEEEETPEANSILYVKGLNFDTSEDHLKQHFQKCGRIHSVTIAMKKDPHNPGKKLSMGYGFIQYFTKNAAEKALKSLQLSTLEGKQIEIKRSERTSNNEVKTSKKETKIGKQTGTKILVRNVPFQADRKEIHELFGAFGDIKALRIPKKLQLGESQHRGFCFVEYHNKGDAKRAFDALCQSTHLYGRRLVLEWAKLEDDNEMLDELRKRTADLYNQRQPGGKKSKKAVADIENMEED